MSCALNIHHMNDGQASGSPIVIESNCFVSPMRIVGIFGCCNGATNAVLKEVTARPERQRTLCCSELLLLLVDVDLSGCAASVRLARLNVAGSVNLPASSTTTDDGLRSFDSF